MAAAGAWRSPEPERRLASDGAKYTYQEFFDNFGHVQGQRLWERRVADDGIAYNCAEFAARFGKPAVELRNGSNDSDYSDSDDSDGGSDSEPDGEEPVGLLPELGGEATLSQPDVEPGGEPWQRAWERAVVARTDELQAGEPDETGRDVEVRFLGGESVVLRGLSPSAPIVGVRGAVKELRKVSSMKTVQLMSGTRILQDWDPLSTVEESYVTAVVVTMPLSKAAFDLLSTWHNRFDTEENLYNLIEIPRSQEYFDFSLVAEIVAKTCAKRLIFGTRSGDVSVLAAAMRSLGEPPRLQQLEIRGVKRCHLADVSQIICQSPGLLSCALSAEADCPGLLRLRREDVADLRAQFGGVRITI